MLSLAFLGLIVVPVTIIQVQNQQNTQQRAESLAWLTSQSAATSCSTSSSQAVINVTFNNTEPNQSVYAMNVVATDQQTGKSVDLGSITGGSSKTGQIMTGMASLNSGTVTFALTWTDGHSGTDSRTANYNAINNCSQPSPTLQPSPTQQPTAIPTPYPSDQPSPTPTVCPTLKPVQNVKITCPNCQ